MKHISQSALAKLTGKTKGAICQATKDGRLNTYFRLIKQDEKYQKYMLKNEKRKLQIANKEIENPKLQNEELQIDKPPETVGS